METIMHTDDKQSRAFTESDRQKAQESRELSKNPRQLIQSVGLVLDPDALAELVACVEKIPRSHRQNHVRFVAGQYASPLKCIRLKCLDCQGYHSKMVKYCPSDGTHSTFCPQWPHRFGCTPKTAKEKHGAHLLDPDQMPDANTPIEELP
jgi:hypothetical protein